MFAQIRFTDNKIKLVKRSYTLQFYIIPHNTYTYYNIYISIKEI